MDLAELKKQNESEGAENQNDMEDTGNDDNNLDTHSGAGDNDADLSLSEGLEQKPDENENIGDEAADTNEEEELWKIEDNSTLPLSAHVKMKHKLKGRISDRENEIEKLKSEIESLKNGSKYNQGEASVLKRPREYDFDTDEEYQIALDKYETAQLNARFADIENRRRVENEQQAAMDRVKRSVEGHYERANKLIRENGIDKDVYRASDLVVREAIDTIMPNQGDIVTNQLISYLGDGSEKIMYYLGRNKPVLNEFKALLAEDKTGIKAALFLGEQKAKLTTPAKRTSTARQPARDIKGDEQLNNSSKRLLSKYKEAHKKGNIQEAYNLKKQAKMNKIDVSGW